MWLIVLPLGVTAPWRDREAPAGLRSSRAPHPRPASCTAIFKPGAGKATCRHLSSARPTPFLTLTLLWENTNPLPSPAASRVTDPHPSRGPSQDPRSPRPSPGSREGSRDACRKVDAAAAGREAEGGRLARRGPCPRGCPAEDRRAGGQRRPLRGGSLLPERTHSFCADSGWGHAFCHWLEAGGGDSNGSFSNKMTFSECPSSVLSGKLQRGAGILPPKCPRVLDGVGLLRLTEFKSDFKFTSFVVREYTL